MLSPEEFMVGSFSVAKPGSLMLPRNKHESLALICEGDGESVAVVLGGDYVFHSFPSSKADNWKGLIVPEVRVEVDEGSLHDPGHYRSALGTVVRKETKIMVLSRSSSDFAAYVPVVIKSGLPNCVDSAGFTRWQVVVGRGDAKRVLHKVDLGDLTSS